jgi:hypothetical protein
MNDSAAQEERCIAYLRSRRRCVEFYYDDENVRSKLVLPRNVGCADILALHQFEELGVTEITIAESKGSDGERLLEQLGNTAAGALAFFPRIQRVNLLLWVKRIHLQRTQGGVYRTPAPGFRVDTLDWPDGTKRATLMDAHWNSTVVAKPTVKLPQEERYRQSRVVVSQLRIEVIEDRAA